MRESIGVYNQQSLIDLGISEKELRLIDQLSIYNKSALMDRKVKDGKSYFWIKFKKIQEDIPYLKISDRMYRNYIQHLTSIGILTKFKEKSSKLYLNVNLDPITQSTNRYEFEIDRSPTKIYSQNTSVIHIYTGVWEIYNRDLDFDQKHKIQQYGTQKFITLLREYLSKTVKNKDIISGAFDTVKIELETNNLIKIRAIHASAESLRNVSDKIFRALSFALETVNKTVRNLSTDLSTLNI